MADFLDDDDDAAALANLLAEPKTTPVSVETAIEDDGVDDGTPPLDTTPIVAAPPSTWTSVDEDDDGDDEDDPEAIMASMGARRESNTSDIAKAWMHYHEFVVVQTLEEIEAIYKIALKTGKCALDLETDGLDNRIYWHDPDTLVGAFEEPWEEGSPRPKLIPQTVHKIVGYCLSPDGHTGYYIPVRHRDDGAKDNLDITAVGRLIRKFCLAAQPELTIEGAKADPLGSPLIKTPPRIRLFFHHAKFDQEFLFPVTGIDYWHPESFEDSLLLYFCLYSDDKQLGLKQKSKANLVVQDAKGNPILGFISPNPRNPLQELVREDPKGNPIPYEMIELKELFIRGRKIDFGSLSPEEARRYACSDAICTYLHCDSPLLVTVARDRKYSNTYRLEKQVSQVLRFMERNRIKIDMDYVRNLCEEAKAESAQYREQILELAKEFGFPNLDINSTQQLGDFLFSSKYLNIEPKPEKNEKSGNYKTDADTLEKLVEEHSGTVNAILLVIVKYRQIEKVVNTYLESMLHNCDANNELRYQFKQTGAPTGRFTAPSGDPAHGYGGIPIHGIPATYDEKKPKVATALRKAFMARPGYTMVKVDFAGEELRIVTNLSGEPVWIKEFNEGTGDLHTITAKAFFGENITKQQRQQGKCVHPDTLVFSGGRPIPLRLTGTFPETPDTFSQWSGTLFDGHLDQEVTHLYNGGEKDLFHVVISGGILTCTGEHRLKTREGSWVRVKDLQEGTYLEECPVPLLGESAYPTLTFSLWEGLPPQGFTPNHALAYFAGVYAGDGTGSKTHVAITHGEPGKIDAYGVDFEEWRSHLESTLTSCGFKCSRKDSTSIYFGSTVVVRFLNELEVHRKTTKNLRVPSWIMSAGRESVLNYLGGLFDTDGTVGEDSHNLDWTTKDFIFAGQVSTLLKSCGLSFNTELTFNKTYQRYYARLRLTVESSWNLRDYLRHPGKKSRLHEPQQPGKTKDRFQVVRVIPAGVGPCLDVTMGTDDHQYQANGFVSHNSANFSLVYGGGTMAIMRATKCTKEEAARRKQNFDKSMPTFAKWVKNQKALVKQHLGVYTAFGRWMSIPNALSEDKAIAAACERCSLNYPIQGTGADVMKMGLVMLYKDFWMRGWIQDQSARFMLTVHDEIVFEVKHEMLQQVMPVIEEVMVRPSYMLKTWAVKFEVEPLIDLHWDPHFDYHKIMDGYLLEPGKKPKKDEFEIDGRYYQPVPKWLVGHLTPKYMQEGKAPVVTEPPEAPAKPPEPPQDPEPQLVYKEAEKLYPAGEGPGLAPSSPPTQGVVSTPPPQPVSQQAPAKAKASKGSEVTSFVAHLRVLRQSSVERVFDICRKCSDPKGQTLKLYDPYGGPIIEDTLGVRVNRTMFELLMKEYFLV